MSDNLGILRELTGQESGIVIYENNAMIICNWTSIDGLPSVFMGNALIGYGEDVEQDEEPKGIDDIYDYLYSTYSDKLDLLWDVNGDINELQGLSGTLYSINDGIIIIAPDGWN